ncbi:hypothetical protein [Actinospongicola halichondriae]|uniref:hypothetical protein n=1 Tax=Actinospongicola halichondriae TaxID=3236844 RepID=UPI003D375423
MLTVADLDPVLLARVRAEQPRLWPNHLRLARVAHGLDVDELDTIDAELEVLAARRRAVLDRLAALRPRLWPESYRRHVRRRCRVDERALAPPVVGAEVLVGVDLRRVLVGIVRRHGEVSLRELHGLIHRHGYEVGGERPVQRLGDAAAYETREGRLRRVGRGVYAPVAGEAGAVDGVTSDPLGQPLAWDRPECDEPPPLDPAVADDQDRWSDQQWPATAQCGGDLLPSPVDPAHRSLGEDLTAHVAATRRRLAALVADRLRAHAGPASTRPSTDHPTTRFDSLGADSLTNRSPGMPMGGRAGDGSDGEDDGVP